MENTFTKSIRFFIFIILSSLISSSFDGPGHKTRANVTRPGISIAQNGKTPDNIKYNSQEHKISADFGVSRVKIPSSVKFPEGVYMQKTNDEYQKKWRAAKNLAVGFITNNENDYNQYKEHVQDNYYWYSFGQRSYNLINYIEDVKPDSLLMIQGIVGNVKDTFSFGDLVAIYGDYRRTVSGDGTGLCYLTNDDNYKLWFKGGNTAANYSPGNTTVGDYLHKIAYGLVPPYGKFGNEGANTAGDAEYDEAGWWGDEMLRIADINDNHFSNAAIAWYIGMHRLALLSVKKATTDPNYWHQALHYEASALHSLTDLFAFGHVVTNRDQCAYGAMKNNNLLDAEPYVWMENVIKMGGGSRDQDGIISLSSDLPSITNKENARHDFMKSYLGTWARWAEREHTYHDYFNDTGAVFRNFNGDQFKLYGDGKLHEMTPEARRVIENAVQFSVQALFDSFDMLRQGKSEDEIGKSGSSYFNALKYVPIFIESDPDNYFTGMWTLYANDVRIISGLGPLPPDWKSCRIRFLSGKNGWPSKQKSPPCTNFKR